MTDTNKTGKQERQDARAAAVARAKRWLEMRKTYTNECKCDQCQSVIKRQAVFNAVSGYSIGMQRSLFDSLG